MQEFDDILLFILIERAGGGGVDPLYVKNVNSFNKNDDHQRTKQPTGLTAAATTLLTMRGTAVRKVNVCNFQGIYHHNS